MLFLREPPLFLRGVVTLKSFPIEIRNYPPKNLLVGIPRAEGLSSGGILGLGMAGMAGAEAAGSGDGLQGGVLSPCLTLVLAWETNKGWQVQSRG